MDEQIPQPQGNPQPQQGNAPNYGYPPQPTAPIRTYPPQNMPSAFESIVRSTTFLTLIFLGMLFLFLGMLMFSILPEITGDAAKHVLTVGYIFATLGMFLLSTFLMIAAVVRKEMEKHMRVMLMIAALVLIWMWISYLNLVSLIGSISSLL